MTRAGSGNGEDPTSRTGSGGRGLDAQELKRRGEAVKDDPESAAELVKEAIREVIAEVERLPDDPDDPTAQ